MTEKIWSVNFTFSGTTRNEIVAFEDRELAVRVFDQAKISMAKDVRDIVGFETCGRSYAISTKEMIMACMAEHDK